MDDRIKIGDVWYVKESEVEVKEDFEIEHTKEMQIETDEFLLVASVLLYEGEWKLPSIDQKDKYGSLIECMDNESWLLGVANRDSGSLNQLSGTNEFKRAVIQLCDEMHKLNWI